MVEEFTGSGVGEEVGGEGEGFFCEEGEEDSGEVSGEGVVELFVEIAEEIAD